MRLSTRLLARAERYLTPGNPTGLCGLLTHPAPRPELLNAYYDTLDILKQFPSSSTYRTSAEALTKQRLAIVEKNKPRGYEEWLSQVKKEHPELVETEAKRGRIPLVLGRLDFSPPEEETAWDNERGEPTLEGKRPEGTKVAQIKAAILNQRKEAHEIESAVTPEPRLESEQVSAIENEIGAGLIEEVIAVAYAERDLAKVMLENKVWEELVEKAPEGQWTYFPQDQHVKGTQAPPS